MPCGMVRYELNLMKNSQSLIFSLKLERNFDCTQLKVVHEHSVRRNKSVAWDLIDAEAESRRDNYTATLARAHTSNSTLDALGKVEV